MHALTIAKVAVSLGYAVLPYLVIHLAIADRDHPRSVAGRLVLGTVVGLGGVVAAATLTSAVSFPAYLRLHAAAGVAGIACLVWSWTRSSRRWSTPLARRVDLTVLAIVVVAAGVRAAPLLLGGETLGGNDARFHNVLSQKILVEGKLGETWSPIASVPVVYTRGVHVLCAFIAAVSGVSVHEAFNALFPLIGALNVAVVYGIGVALFDSRGAGRLSAAAYAFLPAWGSLDYFRWGGLPNAVGMLLLCAVVWILVLQARTAPDGGLLRQLGTRWAWVGAFLVAATALVHHHSFLVTAIVLCFGVSFAASPGMRAVTLAVGAGGAILASPVLLTSYAAHLGRAGTTSVFQFREPSLTLWDCFVALNPVFVILFAGALATVRRVGWDARRILVLSWFAALLSTFVFFEYVYRAASLLLTAGRDMFTGFTPSRMATDLAYPMAVLCGAAALSDTWRRRRRGATAILVLACAATCTYAIVHQRGIGVYPTIRDAGRWIRENTPPDSLVVGQLPHLEYSAWRECSHPALPASEPRNDPSLAWKRNMRGPAAWREWSLETGREVYFVVPNRVPPPPLYRAYANSDVTIYRVSESGEPRP